MTRGSRLPVLSSAAIAAIAIAVAILAWASGDARAAQTTIAISMTPPPATPRIQPPFLVGARPGTPFLFAIPATGQTPLTFSATGLPAGLALAASTGVITGTAPAAGSYAIAVSVTNGSGSAAATLTLMSGGMLRPTPPMGWNSYDSFGASITESEVLQQAQALRSQLQPFGWNMVVIDYRWYEPNQPADANGRYLPAPSKYPSATGTTGFTTLADKVHQLGLGLGIHIMRGIPRVSVTANTPIAGATYRATDAANQNDPCPWDTHMWGVHGDTAAGQAWYDSIFAQYAAWGIDFVKIDDMLNNSTKVYHQAEADAIRKAVDKSGRAMVISFSPGPDDPSWLPSSVANLNIDAEMWRVVDDFWDYAAITDLPGVFRAAGTWQAANGLVQGHWPDLDMLPLGYLGPRVEWSNHTNGDTTFTHNEQVSILSLWSIFPSPLIFGGNVQSLMTSTTSGPWTTALLTNEEVLAVNQDSMGAHAKRIAQQGTTEVWARDLSGGRKAVALFNRGTQDATITATFAQLGVTGTPAVRDVWHRADVTGNTGMANGLSVNVPYGGALMYTLSAPGTGGAGGSAGGAGGAGGRGGSAGSAGSGGGGGRGGAAGSAGAGGNTGGAAGTGAAGAGAGASGNGGAAAGAGGNGGASGSGGTTGSAAGASGGVPNGGGGGGGTTGAGGAGPQGGAGRGGATTSGTGGTTGAASGCSCELSGARTSRFSLAFVLVALVTLRRRRRRRAPLPHPVPAARGEGKRLRW